MAPPPLEEPRVDGLLFACGAEEEDEGRVGEEGEEEAGSAPTRRRESPPADIRTGEAREREVDYRRVAAGAKKVNVRCRYEMSRRARRAVDLAISQFALRERRAIAGIISDEFRKGADRKKDRRSPMGRIECDIDGIDYR